MDDGGRMAEAVGGDKLLPGNGRYKTLASLSSGAYGTVQLAVDTETHNLMAVKFLPRGEHLSSKYVQREIINHSRLIHPHIVQFRDVFLTDTHLAIVMDYVQGGDLFAYVDTAVGLDEDTARYFYQQLITGLDYCHQLGVVHRDLKLENTLLDNSGKYAMPILKICDFGYSKHEPRSMPKSRVGTPGYTAPEVLTSRARIPHSGRPADVWSSGVMLFAMIFLQMPFDRLSDDEHPSTADLKVMKRILAAEIQIPKAVASTQKPPSPELVDLLHRIFVRDPVRRISVADIQTHPWFVKNLPPNVAEMTSRCLELSSYFNSVSEEYVQQLVDQARTAPNGQATPAQRSMYV